MKIYRFCIIAIVVLIHSAVYGINKSITNDFEKEYPFSFYKLLESKDEKAIVLENNYKASLLAKDTLAQIKVLNSLGGLYCNRINYEKSYDSYWKSLLLSEKIGAKRQIAETYNGLAILYSLYERRKEALQYYLKSLRIRKELVEAGLIEKEALLSNYSVLATHYFYDGNIVMNKKYVDSCKQLITANDERIFYVHSQQGYAYLLQKKYDRAENLLLKSEVYFKENHPENLVVLYAMLGDVYKGWKKNRLAIKYYKLSNAMGYKFKSNLNFLPDTYEKLFEAFKATSQDFLAQQNLIKSYEINQYLYSSRSPKNKYLLEIKDRFMQEKERVDKLAADQQLESLKHKEALWKLRATIVFISVCFLLVVGFVLYRYLNTKHANEKQIILQKRILEEQKSKEIFEIKNKELTESTLRLLAKDELLSEVKSTLQELAEKPSTNGVKKLVKQININSKENWQEFESRFTMVNEGFYERMKERFPNLSPYDLKVSALIKLGFSGKEMAKVMGISHESANTARYRLRKRIQLEKQDNLVAFIKSI